MPDAETGDLKSERFGARCVADVEFPVHSAMLVLY